MSRGRNITAAGRRRQKQERAAGPALARSRVYGLLAQALRYPDADGFAALSNGGWASELAAAARQSGVGRGSSFWAEFERLPETLPVDLADLQGLYNTLFSSGNVCPHQESDYAAGHVFQKADVMADVAGFYAAFGLRLSGVHRELPDFLGTELEFLHVAAFKEAQARRRGRRAAAALCRQAQEKFLAEHLGAWVGPFRQKMEGTPAGPFYVLLARVIESFVSALGIKPRPAPLPVLTTAAEPSEESTCAGCS